MDLVSQLEKWVNEHPEEADAPFMNVTTQRKYTLRQLLAELKSEQESGGAIKIVDEEVLAIKKNVADWLGGR